MENCQTCLKPQAEEQSKSTTQWISACRCNQTYSPNTQFSIPFCFVCKRRIVSDFDGTITHIELCSCPEPNPLTVPTFSDKKIDNEESELDPSSIGLGGDIFPVELYKPLGFLGANTALARQRNSGRKVAVKCLKGIADENLIAFEKEIKQVDRLNHPNMARIIDSGIHNNTPYIVTEYKDGFSLEHYFDLYGKPSHDIALMILVSVCEAIAYANKEKVLHEELKPSDIIFIDDKNSKPSSIVTDIGLSRLREAKPSPKLFRYMSCEQARGIKHDERSEVYSIGSLAFELLTGRPPFLSNSAQDLKNEHALKLPPKISDIAFEAERPKDFEAIVERCLEKDPRDRFESVAQLYERLDRIQTRESFAIEQKQLELKTKKNMIRFSIAGAALLVLALIVYAIVQATAR